MNYKNRILAFFLALALFVPVLPAKTWAQTDTIPPIPVSDSALRNKDVGITIMGYTVPGISLDYLMIIVVKAALERILDSTVEWINSGFEGNPAFVTDPKQFYSDIAD